jgi:hypothetical protein
MRGHRAAVGIGRLCNKGALGVENRLHVARDATFAEMEAATESIPGDLHETTVLRRQHPPLQRREHVLSHRDQRHGRPEIINLHVKGVE